MKRAATLLVLLFTVSPLAARADAIDGPPACPPGAVGRSSHSGQWCEPAVCASDADCASTGGHCRAYRVCTRHASIPPGGLGQFRDPPPSPDEVDVVVGSCEPAAACRGDEEPPPPTAGTLTGDPSCREASFCVPDELPSLPTGSPSPSPSASRSCPTGRPPARQSRAPRTNARITAAIASARGLSTSRR